MVGADGDVTSGVETSTTLDAWEGANTTLYVPLEFWFCRNIGLALPLIALQYHEVKIKIEFEQLNNCVYKISGGITAPLVSSGGVTNEAADLATLSGNLNASIWVDYIFLDTDERRRFAQLSHEYLIEQLQFTGQETLNAGANRIKLNFNHPTKELIWVAKSNTSSSVDQWYNYTNTGSGSGIPAAGSANFALPLNANAVFENNLPTTLGNYNAYSSNLIIGVVPTGSNPFNSCLIQLNGNDRFAERNGTYFNYVQQYQHHTNISDNKGINVYSFALKPEDHQPSGSLNMSRIDTAVLSVNSGYTASANINIYAVNYNVLRILSGMGGLAYSN
jgi:hypothetical protein